MAQVQKSKSATVNLSIEEKESDLRFMMREMQNVLVAYSGGVDSAYLALIATQELKEKCVCVLGISPSVSKIQREEAEKIASEFNLNLQTIQTEELENPNYQANPNNRCYFCKTELYGKLSEIARGKNIKHIIDGTNADDVADYRPGRAAAEENSVKSPFVMVGLSKKEIRILSKKHGLPTWDKPASPCLSSRIAYGVPVTIERLSKVEKGEMILRNLGFKEFRVRLHDDLVRIEIAPNELINALNLKITQEFTKKFKDLGFRYVTLDLQGYRSGAMNETLNQSDLI
ncbi:MAG TPA: ATP-dependent sacrificial sulfur transferase LarE [Pyrinomonadaceae bacterium]|jgi:uncharacterized protein